MTDKHGWWSLLSRVSRPVALSCALLGLVEYSDCLADGVAATPTANAVWTPTGKLNVARFGHTATLLPNGKVLVAGGMPNYTQTLNSAELYDPDGGIWSLTGQMKVSRHSHTATLLSNGQVLVAGGETGSSLTENTAELYDPATGSWTLTGKMSGARSGYTATLLQNGQVLLAGGWGADAGLRTAELYDPVTGTWRATGSLITARYWHAATILNDGKVLVVAGSNEGDLYSVLGSAELYDPGDEMWRSAGSLKFGAVATTATLLGDGTVLVAGGYGNPYPGFEGPSTSMDLAQIYNPATVTWSNTINLRVARGAHTATLLPSGDILIVGGNNVQIGHGYVNGELNQTELYSHANSVLADGPSLGAARVNHTATLLRNGKVLVAGGGSAVAELYGSPPVAGTIVASTTGSWYNPAQDGHGFMLEVLPGTPMQLLAGWFVFGPQGGPSWIVGLGPVNGNQAVVQGMQALGPGGRFPPNFDRTNIVDAPWGTLTFSFTDCNHGHVDWNSTAPGYGSGGMDLVRLTLPAGLSCPN